MRKLSLSNRIYSSFLLLGFIFLTSGCGDSFNGNNSRRGQFNGNGNGNNNGARTPRNVSAPACPATLKADNGAINDLVRPARGIMDAVDKTRADAAQKATVQLVVTACDEYFKKYDANLVCQDSLGRIYKAVELKSACDRMNVFVN